MSHRIETPAGIIFISAIIVALLFNLFTAILGVRSELRRQTALLERFVPEALESVETIAPERVEE